MTIRLLDAAQTDGARINMKHAACPTMSFRAGRQKCIC
jgi:hypothetical protein